VTTVVLVAVVLILSVAVALVSAGLVEVYAELRQVRTLLHLQDQPSRLHLPTLGRAVQELVPQRPPALELDSFRSDSYLLVLSNSCSVCHTIGSDLAQAKPAWADGLTVLVASETEQAGEDFVAGLGLRWPRLFVDRLGLYAKQLGIDNSPTVLKILNGRLDSAANLTSLRQLQLFVEGRTA
jgi:hypothetical protein